MRFLAASSMVVLLAACATNAPAPSPTASTQATESLGFDVANLNRSAQPCQDFYEFATGGWRQRNPIPPAYSRWGTFSALGVANQEKMRLILEDAARNSGAAGTDRQRVGDFYAACMDEATVERSGLTPLQSKLQRISAIRTQADLVPAIAELHRTTTPVTFGFGSIQDFKNTEQVVATIGQSGLGLPDRDYYLQEDQKSREIRERYLQHVARLLQLAGDSPAEASQAARSIMALETKLAEASMTKVQLRDPNALYNKMTLAELRSLTPSFSWDSYFAGLGIAAPDTIIVGQPDFLRELQRQITATDLETWRDYLRFHLINSNANRLPSRFVEANFDFYGRYLEGRKELLPRWRRCAAAVDAAMGEGVGRLWTERYFPASAKAEALEMVKNLMEALREDIETLAWMGPDTRRQALSKLQAFATKIGYPDAWRDYSALAIDRGPYVENALAADEFELRRQLNKIGRPVDRTEWLLSPPTVNAYNNPLMNEIVFPAGILQPPFYDPDTDDAYNYGGIGAVIGHELIHGFDDEGRQFDARGNLADWWTAEDKERFLERAKCVAEQFGSFDLGGGLRMKGDLVLGESIADLGGLEIAYAAYKKSQEGKPRQIIDGFTPEQRFFLGWAQVWAANATAEAERLQVTTDPHPLPRYRVNGPLANMPAFAEAFGCPRSAPMVRSDDVRCDIW